MKNIMALAIAALFLLLSPSCGGGSGALSDQAMDVTEDFVELMESLDSKEAAEKAAPELKQLATQMKELRAKIDALSAEEKEEMSQAIESSDEGKDLMKRMVAVMGKVMMDSEIGLVLAPLMQSLED